MRFIRELLSYFKLAKEFKLVVFGFCLLGSFLEGRAKDISMIDIQPTQLAEINRERVGLFCASYPNLIINAGGYDIKNHTVVNSIDVLRVDKADKPIWDMNHQLLREEFGLYSMLPILDIIRSGTRLERTDILTLHLPIALLQCLTSNEYLNLVCVK